MKVELLNVKKEYNGRVVLDIGFLEFESGKIHAVMGPNGSGKTTLLRLIAGMELCTDGNILYNGSNHHPISDINFLLQKPYMFKMSVLDNVLLGSGEKDRQIALEVLDKVGMKDFAKSRACSLSSGEAQKVAIARTLLAGKKLNLLDEPLSAVDISSTEKVDKYIDSVNKEYASTIVIATHSPSEALKIADNIVLLWNGRIIEKGKPEDVLKSPSTEQGKAFMRNWRI